MLLSLLLAVVAIENVKKSVVDSSVGRRQLWPDLIRSHSLAAATVGRCVMAKFHYADFPVTSATNAWRPL